MAKATGRTEDVVDAIIFYLTVSEGLDLEELLQITPKNAWSGILDWSLAQQPSASNWDLAGSIAARNLGMDSRSLFEKSWSQPNGPAVFSQYGATDLDESFAQGWGQEQRAAFLRSALHSVAGSSSRELVLQLIEQDWAPWMSAEIATLLDDHPTDQLSVDIISKLGPEILKSNTLKEASQSILMDWLEISPFQVWLTQLTQYQLEGIDGLDENIGQLLPIVLRICSISVIPLFEFCMRHASRDILNENRTSLVHFWLNQIARDQKLLIARLLVQAMGMYRPPSGEYILEHIFPFLYDHYSRKELLMEVDKAKVLRKKVTGMWVEECWSPKRFREAVGYRRSLLRRVYAHLGEWGQGRKFKDKLER